MYRLTENRSSPHDHEQQPNATSCFTRQTSAAAAAAACWVRLAARSARRAALCLRASAGGSQSSSSDAPCFFVRCRLLRVRLGAGSSAAGAGAAWRTEGGAAEFQVGIRRGNSKAARRRQAHTTAPCQQSLFCSAQSASCFQHFVSTSSGGQPTSAASPARASCTGSCRSTTSPGAPRK